MNFYSKLFVLKQSWQPREVESEGNLYEAANGMLCDNIGSIQSWEEVLVCGKSDTTDGLIRHGLDDSTSPGKRPRSQTAENHDASIYTICTSPDDIQELRARGSGSPVSRVRTRVVLSTYGWLIKYFSTLSELLQVLRDAIKVINGFCSDGSGITKGRCRPQASLPQWRSASRREPRKHSHRMGSGF